MMKQLGKAMMHRSKLKNKFHKLKTESAHAEYRKQKNIYIPVGKEIITSVDNDEMFQDELVM